jgi:hypothetical protein
MSTKPKPQAAKAPAKPQAAKTAAPAGATVAPVPAAGDLQFDLGGSLSQKDGPVVTITVPTPDEPAMRERFERVSSVEIEASALMPGIACPFTLGCAEKGGKVRIMSDVTVPRQLPDGKTAVQRAQQFHCRTCGCVAKGVKFIGGAAVGMGGGPKLFNRLTGKSE